MSSLPEREEIDPAYKWELESIYESDEDWERAYEAVEDRIEDLEADEGRIENSAEADTPVEDGAETLLDVLERRESIMREVGKVVSYAQLRSSEDTRNQEYQAMASRADTLVSDAYSATSFLEPELQALGRQAIEAYVAAEPALAEYEHYFDDVLRTAPHTRSAEVEELLADLSEVTGGASDVYSMLTNADMDFPTVEDGTGEAVEITLSNFTSLQKRPDRKFRRDVHEAFYDQWGEVRNAVGSALQNSVKADVKLARARRYDTAREAAMDGPNVPTEVYDNLLETVQDNLGVLHEHVRLKRRALGVDELQMWDLYASLEAPESEPNAPESESNAPEIEYDRAREWIVDAVAPLGDAYQRRLAEGLDSRWVDVRESRGKRSGAFSAGAYDTQPFILLNYQDDVSSVFTLAHELGHSLHSELTKDAQPWHYSDYDIFVAEVASTVNETLLTHHLLETLDDDRLRRHVLDEYLERFRSTLFRQTMFAAFELRTHQIVEEGGALTPDRFDQVYGELKGEFYEPAIVDERIEREWMRIPHFYNAYYVYQYATGIAAAVAIVERIRDEGEPAAADYREALELGGAAYPLEVLDTAGVDMTTPEPIEDAISVYEGYIDEMDALLE